MPQSFGGKKPYLADFEISDEIAPDPFSEEPAPRSAMHKNRASGLVPDRTLPEAKRAKAPDALKTEKNQE